MWILAIGVALALVPAVRAETGVAESDLFIVDTRYSLDTVTAVSGLFTVDTLYGKGVASAASRLFNVDTRIGGSSGANESPFFTLDTRSGSLPGVSISGCVRNKTGGVVPGVGVGAFVNGQQFAGAVTGGDGLFALPTLPVGTYELRAFLTGWLSDIRRGFNIAGTTPIANFDFYLELLPSPPQVLSTLRQIEATQRRPLVTINSTQLRVFGNGAFQTNVPLDPGKMTVVMTHGWNSSSEEWPTGIAQEMEATGVAANINIVAWDWKKKAAQQLSQAEDRTSEEGLALGRLLWRALGMDYDKKVHFIGHSLGTLVNARAANYIHGDNEKPEHRAPAPWAANRTHVTLFDEAELAQVGGLTTIIVAGLPICLNAARRTDAATFAVVQGRFSFGEWADPIPRRAAWVDNYVTAAGVYHRKAVNVFLRQGAQVNGSYNVIEYHSYPTRYYRKTVQTPNLCQMGFMNSFELRGSLPPTGDDYKAGALYLQEENSGSELGLTLIDNDPGFFKVLEVQSENFANTCRVAGRQAWQVAEVVGTVAIAVVENIDIEIEHPLDIDLSPIDPLSQTTGLLGLRGVLSPPSPNYSSLQCELRTTPPNTPNPEQFRLASMETNIPAYVWIPTAVPSNAVFLAFDFLLTGDGAGDCLAFGINGTNQFCLETEFMPDNVRMSSSSIAVSRWAGKNVELFFGIVGGTSTNAAITVSGIRFYELVPPSLEVTATNGIANVSWPVSAEGYELERTRALGPTNSWNAVTNVPVLTGFRYAVTNAMDESSRFYRLRQD